MYILYFKNIKYFKFFKKEKSRVIIMYLILEMYIDLYFILEEKHLIILE